MKFNYQARTKTGEIQSGTVEASSKESAFLLLKNHNLYVTALEEFSPPVYAKKITIFERISNKDVVIFSRQLAIMFKSEVPLVESLETLAKQTKNSAFKEKILKIAEEVEGGTPLSQALALYPKIFSTFYINMVKSGEASGKLTDIFLYLADYLEREHNSRSKIMGAMIYPAFVLLVFLAVIILIIVYVIPQLTEVLESTGQELPLITQVVIGLSEFMRSWGWAVLLGILVLGFFLFRYSRTEKGKKVFDSFFLRIPLVSSFLQKFYLSRFALNLSTLISGGLPIVQALEITGKVVGNEVYKKIILETRDGVKRGETMSSILQAYPKNISPFFYQMVVVGEKTGTLDSSLTNVVEFYQQDINRGLDNFIKMLEPIFIIILGLIVAGLMGAVLIPIYSIGMM